MCDERIKKDMVDHFFWDGRIDASDVQVDVSDGKVILTGMVPTFTARQAAEFDAYLLDGVRYVENNLEVAPHETSDLTDDEVAVNIKSLLMWSPEVDDSHVDIDAVSGMITLNGTVDAYWKKLRIEELVTSLMEVTQVVNNLTVAPPETPSDRMIAERIGPVLARDARINADAVNVAVKDGTVVLSGTVPSWTAYQAAEEAARYTPGVIDVQNELIIY